MLWSNECSSLQALGYTAVARACPKEVYKRQDVAAISGHIKGQYSGHYGFVVILPTLEDYR